MSVGWILDRAHLARALVGDCYEDEAGGMPEVGGTDCFQAFTRLDRYRYDHVL
jgi:hypothetical protein